MRTLLLLLVLANFLFIAAQLDVFGDVLHEPHEGARIVQLNPERLRIVRDTSTRAPSASPTPSPASTPQ